MRSVNSKFDQVLTCLREELSAGKYPVGSRFPSEYDLAERFGIGKLTVNKAVSKLVYDGFLLRGARGSNTKVISCEIFPKGYFMFVAPLGHDIPREMLIGVQNYAFMHGYSVIFYAPPPDCLVAQIHRLQRPEITGILTSTYGIVEVPGKLVIHLDTALPDSDTVHHSLCPDYFSAGKQMLEAVLSKGHREVLLYHYPCNASAVFWRKGAQEAMYAGGVENIRDRTFSGADWETSAVAGKLKMMLKAFPKTTCIVTASDNDAEKVIEALRMLEIAENQICVTGCGNLARLKPFLNLPTVALSPVNLGILGCEELIAMLENGLPETPLRKITEITLVNTGAIPSLPFPNS